MRHISQEAQNDGDTNRVRMEESRVCMNKKGRRPKTIMIGDAKNSHCM